MENSKPETSDLVWGANGIAEEIGKTKRATFHLLEKGQLPGATKIGNQWVLSRKLFRERLERGAA